MTFDDDFVRLHFVLGTFNFACVKIGLGWPPPEQLVVSDEGFRGATAYDDPAVVMTRMCMSAITDGEREGMSHVARGAEYRYEEVADG